MKRVAKKIIWSAAAWSLTALFAIAFVGPNPFAAKRNTNNLLGAEAAHFQSGVQRQSNGIYAVRALTPMPGAKAEMVRWWFADYMKTTAHYRRWHPQDHLWMDWENKTPGQIIGASHLVHENIGAELHKLRIQFVPPGEYLQNYAPAEGLFVLCARAGSLDAPINFSTMCHIVEDGAEGAHMRSVFWLGDISTREGDQNVWSWLGFFGNTWLARQVFINRKFAQALQTHAEQEMQNLSGFLPALYQRKAAGRNHG